MREPHSPPPPPPSEIPQMNPTKFNFLNEPQNGRPKINVLSAYASSSVFDITKYCLILLFNTIRTYTSLRVPLPWNTQINLTKKRFFERFNPRLEFS